MFDDEYAVGPALQDRVRPRTVQQIIVPTFEVLPNTRCR